MIQYVKTAIIHEYNKPVSFNENQIVNCMAKVFGQNRYNQLTIIIYR